MKVSVSFGGNVFTTPTDASYVVEDCGAVTIWVDGERRYSAAPGMWNFVQAIDDKEPQK